MDVIVKFVVLWSFQDPQLIDTASCVCNDEQLLIIVQFENPV